MAILFLIVFVDLVGFGLIIPLLPFYGEHFHATPAVVGLLMAIYSLAQFVAAPIWGRLSDRIGRKPVLAISLAGATLSYLWLAFAHELWMLFAARALGGFMAGNIDRLRLRRRRHHACQPGEGHGHGRRRLRPRLHLRPRHRRRARRPRPGQCRLRHPGAGGGRVYPPPPCC
ncbi:MAG: MFS transporter [Rhodospirillales bacterium]